jgi:hypothetical protein
MRRRFGDPAHGARRKNFLNPTVEFVIGSGVHAKQERMPSLKFAMRARTTGWSFVRRMLVVRSGDGESKEAISSTASPLCQSEIAASLNVIFF